MFFINLKNTRVHKGDKSYENENDSTDSCCHDFESEDDRVVEASVFVPCVNSSCQGNMNILVPLLSNSWLIG